MPSPARTLRASVVLTTLLLGALVPFAAANAHDEYLEAIQTIRCDCGCHPQSLDDCACGYAENMRGEIESMIKGPDGGIKMTGAEVIAKFIAEKGEQILIAPKATGFNLLAWLGPLIGLAGALLVSLFLIRYLVRRGAVDEPLTATPAPAAEPAAGDDAYHEKLRRQLAEWD